MIGHRICVRMVRMIVQTILRIVIMVVALFKFGRKLSVFLLEMKNHRY